MTKPMTNERLAELRDDADRNRMCLGSEQLGGIIDVIVTTDDVRSLLARLDSAEELIREVANSGVSFDDERLKCLEVQIGRETWTQCQSYLR